MDLSFALSIRFPAVVAFTGAGGKSSAMLRLAGEFVESGRRVVTTTTTRIGVAQADLAPAQLVTTDPAEVLARLPRLLERHRHVMLVGGLLPDEAKAVGVAPDLVCAVARSTGTDAVLVEADGARLLPFKAPGPHEPVVPDCVTLLVPVVGIDVLGGPLDAAHVHRPEVAARLAGAALGDPVTPELLARVLAHPSGGVKGCPRGVRVVPLLNKVEEAGQLAAARDLARRLLHVEPPTEGRTQNEAGQAVPPFERVIVGAVRAEPPVREVYTRTVAVVLAAGSSTRLGRPKQLLDWHGRPLVRHVVETVLAAETDQVVVVVGHAAAEVTAALHALPVTIVDNPEWPGGISTSLRAGLAAASPGWGATIFVQVDQPLLTAPVVDALIRRHRQTLAPIVFPAFAGRRGSPVLFDRALAPELAGLKGDRGGSALLPKYGEHAQAVTVDDPRVLEDIDTEEDYRRLRG